jgi:hypothetical protein
MAMERKFTVRNTLVSRPRYKLVSERKKKGLGNLFAGNAKPKVRAHQLKRGQYLDTATILAAIKEIAAPDGLSMRKRLDEKGFSSPANATGKRSEVVAKAVEAALMRHSVDPSVAVEIVNVRQARNLPGTLAQGRIRLTTRGRKSEIREDTLVTMRYDMLGEVISSVIPEPTLADVFAERPDLPAATRLKFEPQRGGRLPKFKL